jgi:hypothetical protein
VSWLWPRQASQVDGEVCVSELGALVAGVRGLGDALRALEPGVLTADACAELLTELARIEKVCALTRVRLADRVAACARGRGPRDAEASELLARTGGITAREARAELATVRALEHLPAARAAVECGELSLGQAREVVGAAAVAPGSEGSLVDVARSTGVAGLRDAARRVRLAAVSVEELHREQHRRREATTWTDELGMTCLRAVLPPEVGVPVANRLARLADRNWRAARHRQGSSQLLEPRAAYAADALVELLGERPEVGGRGPGGGGAGGGDGRGDGGDRDRASGGGAGRAAGRAGGRADVVLVADVRALARGRAEPGEPCHVVGGGPVPVAVVRHALEDAFVKLVTHDGVRIDQVVHVGRRIPAVLRTALELGAPPEFAGVSCVEEGCDHRYGLEWDHVDPVANAGPTSFDNVEPRCRACHRAKTERDRAAGLLGGSNRRNAERAPPSPPSPP